MYIILRIYQNMRFTWIMYTNKMQTFTETPALWLDVTSVVNESSYWNLNSVKALSSLFSGAHKLSKLGLSMEIFGSLDIEQARFLS